MTVVAILGRKGGSGKSTLSTNIAAWCALNGNQVMLGDVDRQQSMRSWLQRRSPEALKINTWAVDNGKVFRAPPGTTHVVLDTPGGLYGHELAKLVVWIDVIVVPIGPSIFDRDASLDFLKELNKLPKVVSGRCKVAAIGMRWPLDRVAHWYQQGSQWDVPLLTVIPDMAHYRVCLENGGSLFDMSESIRQSDMPHWQPLLAWLDVVWTPADTLRGQGQQASKHVQATAAGSHGRTAVTPPVPRQPAEAPLAVCSSRQILLLPKPLIVEKAARGKEKSWILKWLGIR